MYPIAEIEIRLHPSQDSQVGRFGKRSGKSPSGRSRISRNAMTTPEIVRTAKTVLNVSRDANFAAMSAVPQPVVSPTEPSRFRIDINTTAVLIQQRCSRQRRLKLTSLAIDARQTRPAAEAFCDHEKRASDSSQLW